MSDVKENNANLEISEQLTKITGMLDEIRYDAVLMNNRLDSVEAVVKKNRPFVQSSDRDREHIQDGGCHENTRPVTSARQPRDRILQFETGAPSPEGEIASAAGDDDVQGQFQAIKESLSSLRLAPDLRLNETRTGIQRNDQPVFNNLVKSARYVETTLKLVGSICENNITQADVTALYHIQLAHMRYLQDEFASLIVQGSFDKETIRLFKCFQKNTSGLSPAAISNLRKAAEISGARTIGQNNFNTQNGGFRGRGSQWRGRGFRQFTNRGQNNFRHHLTTSNENSSEPM